MAGPNGEVSSRAPPAGPAPAAAPPRTAAEPTKSRTLPSSVEHERREMPTIMNHEFMIDHEPIFY